MRLYSFQIRGFKSIIDTGECKISESDNIIVLAGQNEAGKSAVLEALDFFRNGPGKNFEKHQARLDSNKTEVVCTFAISEEDNSSLGIDENNTELIKHLREHPHISLVRSHVKGSPTKEVTLTQATADELKQFFPEQDPEQPKPAQPVEAEVVEAHPASAEGAAASPPEDAAPPPKPAPKPAPKPSPFARFSSQVIKAIPPFSLYTSFEDLLPSEIPVSALATSNAVTDFQKVFEVDLSSFAEISDPREKDIKKREIENKATDDFKKFWTQSISSIRGENEYSFSLDRNDIEKKIIFMIKGRDKNPLFLEQKSLGFRWFSAFHLRLRAMMKDEKEGELDSNSGTRFVLLIDEPGQNLHDVAQRDVKNIIEETAKKNIQIIYSTHNPNLIGTEGEEFTRIRLVSNGEKVGTKVDNVAQFISKLDGGSLDTLSPIRTAMGLVNIQSIFDANKFNVVVEGISDHYYLSAFQKILRKDARIRFVPACGVDNVKHVVSILIGWGCNYKAVMDDDPQQGRKAYDLLKRHFFEGDDNLAHQHILKLKDKHGIEDVFSVTDFEKHVLERNRKEEDKGKKNSELARELNKKEMLARLFLEKVQNGQIDDLTQKSKGEIEPIFDWLYEKFGI
ncbi:MAG: AAA family ATPase [Chloroflexi bacterium]|nr:AAA family ATPase [Chloroflexota bacterium]